MEVTAKFLMWPLLSQVLATSPGSTLSVTESEFWASTPETVNAGEKAIATISKILGQICWSRLGLERGTVEKTWATRLTKKDAIVVAGLKTDTPDITDHPDWPTLPLHLFGAVFETMVRQLHFVAQLSWDNLRIELGYITQTDERSTRQRKFKTGKAAKEVSVSTGSLLSKILKHAEQVELVSSHPEWPKIPIGKHGRAVDAEFRDIEAIAQVQYRRVRMEFNYITQVRAQKSTAGKRKNPAPTADDKDKETAADAQDVPPPPIIKRTVAARKIPKKLSKPKPTKKKGKGKKAAAAAGTPELSEPEYSGLDDDETDASANETAEDPVAAVQESGMRRRSSRLASSTVVSYVGMDSMTTTTTTTTAAAGHDSSDNDSSGNAGMVDDSEDDYVPEGPPLAAPPKTTKSSRQRRQQQRRSPSIPPSEVDLRSPSPPSHEPVSNANPLQSASASPPRPSTPSTGSYSARDGLADNGPYTTALLTALDSINISKPKKRSADALGPESTTMGAAAAAGGSEVKRRRYLNVTNPANKDNIKSNIGKQLRDFDNIDESDAEMDTADP